MGSDHVSRVKELSRDLHGMVKSGTRLPKAVADVLQFMCDNVEGPQRLAGRIEELRSPQAKPRSVNGSELRVTLDDCTKFVREFGGIKDADCSKWITRPAPSGMFWPIPDAGWTYEELLVLVAKVPHYDWVSDQISAIDAKYDNRQPDKAGHLLWTPVGIEATAACPDLVGVSYRSLWEMQETVVTAREAIILWLFIYWKFRVVLDIVGWTRTCSRGAHGSGVCVNAYGERLYVYWNYPGLTDPHGSSRSVVLG